MFNKTKPIILIFTFCICVLNTIHGQSFYGRLFDEETGGWIEGARVSINQDAKIEFTDSIGVFIVRDSLAFPVQFEVSHPLYRTKNLSLNKKMDRMIIGMFRNEVDSSQTPLYTIEGLSGFQTFDHAVYVSRRLRLACAEEFVYPEIALQMQQSDKVYVSFIVSETGNVNNIKVERGRYEDLNNEAKRIVGSIPTLVPKYKEGKAVEESYCFPINFVLK
jgi:TonB family protein